MLIRLNDTVEVIAGEGSDALGKRDRGKVLKVDHQSGRLIVEGVNRAYKHVARSQRNPQGGRLSKEMPIQASNVLLVCDTCNRGVRLGARYTADGAKERFCRKCGKALGTISPAKARHAKKQESGNQP